MRIRIVQRPRVASVDGLRLDRFEPGHVYDVGTTLGCLLLSEEWAEPATDDQLALVVPSNHIREVFPPSWFDEFAIAADTPRKRRR